MFVADGDSPPDVECAVCLRPWTAAVELRPCKHVFCGSCVAGLGQCPTCRGPAAERGPAHRILVAIAEAVRVKCRHCDWRGTHGESQSHECDLIGDGGPGGPCGGGRGNESPTTPLNPDAPPPLTAEPSGEQARDSPLPGTSASPHGTPTAAAPDAPHRVTAGRMQPPDSDTGSATDSVSTRSSAPASRFATSSVISSARIFGRPTPQAAAQPASPGNVPVPPGAAPGVAAAPPTRAPADDRTQLSLCVRYGLDLDEIDRIVAAAVAAGADSRPPPPGAPDCEGMWLGHPAFRRFAVTMCWIAESDPPGEADTLFHALRRRSSFRTAGTRIPPAGANPLESRGVSLTAVFRFCRTTEPTPSVSRQVSEQLQAPFGNPASGRGARQGTRAPAGGPAVAPSLYGAPDAPAVRTNPDYVTAAVVAVPGGPAVDELAAAAVVGVAVQQPLQPDPRRQGRQQQQQNQNAAARPSRQDDGSTGCCALQ